MNAGQIIMFSYFAITICVGFCWMAVIGYKDGKTTIGDIIVEGLIGAVMLPIFGIYGICGCIAWLFEKIGNIKLK